MFFDVEEIDEIRLFLAPLVLGGRMARDPLEGEGAETVATRPGRRRSTAGTSATTCCLRADEGVVSAMFTGLISELGRVEGWSAPTAGPPPVAADRLASELRDGDSVAVNGVCLTAMDSAMAPSRPT